MVIDHEPLILARYDASTAHSSPLFAENEKENKSDKHSVHEN